MFVMYVSMHAVNNNKSLKFWFLRFHQRRHPVFFSTCGFTGLVRVGVKIPQDGNRTNIYSHVAMVHKHV